MFVKENSGMSKLFNTTVQGNDSMKAFRNQNLMQGHIVRMPKRKDLVFDTSDEDDGEYSKPSFRRRQSSSSLLQDQG